MTEMEQISDVAVDNIRFAMQAGAMTIVGLSGIIGGPTIASLGLITGLVIYYWSTKFHPDTATIQVDKSLI